MVRSAFCMRWPGSRRGNAAGAILGHGVPAGEEGPDGALVIADGVVHGIAGGDVAERPSLWRSRARLQRLRLAFGCCKGGIVACAGWFHQATEGIDGGGAVDRAVGVCG